MKKALSLSLGLLIVGTVSVPAHADDEIPFEACSKNRVRYVHTQQQADELNKKGCAASVELSVPKLSMPDAVVRGAVGDVLNDVAQQYLKDIGKRKAYWESVKKNFKDRNASCKNQPDDDITKSYGGFVRQLRRDLAKTSLSDQGGHPTAGSALKTFNIGDFNVVPNPFPESVSGSLQPEELKSINADLASGKVKSSDLEAFSKKQYQGELTLGVSHGLYLVAYLPKPSCVKADGTVGWSDSEWASTIDHLITDATHEEKVTNDAIAAYGKDHTVSFPPLGTRDFLAYWNKDKRDLMYYSTLRPEMEKWLAKNPEDCGAAIAATKWMDSNDTKKKIYETGIMMASGLGTGAGLGIKAGSESFAKVGAGLAAVSGMAGGFAGLAMVSSDYILTKDKAETTAKQARKIGVKDGAEPTVVDQKDVAAAQDAANHWVRNNAGQMLVGVAAMGGGAVVGKVVAKAMISKGPEVVQDLARLIASSRKPKEALADIEKLAADNPKLAATLKVNSSARRVELATESGDKLSPEFDKIAGDPDVKPEELAEIKDKALETEEELSAARMKAGTCHSQAECDGGAINDTQGALQKAEVACGGKK